MRRAVLIAVLTAIAGCGRPPARDAPAAGGPHAVELHASLVPVGPERWALRLVELHRDAAGAVMRRAEWPTVAASLGIPVTHEARGEGEVVARIELLIVPAGDGVSARWRARRDDGSASDGVLALPRGDAR